MSNSLQQINQAFTNPYIKTFACTAYSFGVALLANAPTLGLLAKGAIGAIPTALTTITHSICTHLEHKGILAPGRTKQITPIAALAFAAATYGAVVGLGLASPLAALFFVVPTIAFGAYVTFVYPNSPAPLLHTSAQHDDLDQQMRV